MRDISVLAKNADEAIVKIRQHAERTRRRGRYFLVRHYFWWLLWALVCGGVALDTGRPLAALGLLLAPVALLLLGRFMKTAYGLVFLAACMAYMLYQVGSVVPKIHRFLEGTTYKFISGKGALIVPHSGDVIRLYSQDDFYIGAQLKSIGDNVYPGERLLIADFAKEVVDLAQLQEAVRPREAYVDYLLAQHLRKQDETRIQLKVSELERQQLDFEKAQFEEPTAKERSTMEAYRKLLESGLVSKQEFWEIEREYERLKTAYQQLGWQEKQLAMGLEQPQERSVLTQEYHYEKAKVDFLKFHAESQRKWLAQITYIAAPGNRTAPSLSLENPSPAAGNSRPQGRLRLRAQLHADSIHFRQEAAESAPKGEVALPQMDPTAEPAADNPGEMIRKWERGQLIYLAGSRSSSQVRRGELVAEIWVGQQRKRIGFELPRTKMVGVTIGSPINFMLNEEVGDFDAIVHGRIQKIRSYPQKNTFWIEAGDLRVVSQGQSLADFSLGLAGNYRIGLRPISHKEKYLKISDEAQSLGEMWASLRAHLKQYVRREAGEDFVVTPPSR